MALAAEAMKTTEVLKLLHVSSLCLLTGLDG